MSDGSKVRLVLGIVAMGLIAVMVVWATIGFKKIVVGDQVRPITTQVTK